MNYIQKFQLGGFTPNWQQLQSKEINLFPKTFTSLVPMKNPAFKSDIMYNKKRSYLDEYNSLMLKQNILANQLKSPDLKPGEKNKLLGNLAQYPGFINRLYELQQTQKGNK